jgi:hypothetical protein
VRWLRLLARAVTFKRVAQAGVPFESKFGMFAAGGCVQVMCSVFGVAEKL